MKRGFEFQRERKSLADSLREERRKGDKSNEEIQDALREVKKTDKYQITKGLHHFDRRLPSDAKEKAATNLELQDNQEKWDVTDIGNLLPPEFKSWVDFAVLAKANSNTTKDYTNPIPKFAWDIYYKFVRSTPKKDDWEDTEHFKKLEEFSRQRQEFIDKLTGGRFLSPLNFNHIIGAHGGQSADEFREKPFDRYSPIAPSKDGIFWISTYGNGFAAGFALQIVIVSPENPKAREFITNVFNPSFSPNKNKNFLNSFLAATELPKPEYDPHHAGKEYQFEFKQEYSDRVLHGEGYSWMDIADCVIDLKAGKMWTRKYSAEERAEAEKGIATYRDAGV